MSKEREDGIDSIIVSVAYDEFIGKDTGGEAFNNLSKEDQNLFFNLNREVLYKMKDLVPIMIADYEKSDAYNPYDLEPVEVFLMSAPKHFKDELVFI